MTDENKGYLGFSKISISKEMLHPTENMELDFIFLKALKSKIAQDKIRILSEDPRVLGLNNKIIYTGNFCTPFNLEKLVQWYLWYANEFGTEKADCQIESFLNDEKMELQHALWIKGLEVPTSINLFDGVSIVPIDEMPFGTVKAVFLQSQSNFIHAFSSPVQAALVYTHKQNIMFEEPSDFVFEKMLIAQRTLLMVASLINLINELSCLPIYFTSFSRHCPFGPFMGSAGNTFPDDNSKRQNARFLESHRVELERIYINLKKKESAKAKFDLICRKLVHAKRSDSLEDSIVSLVIAMEMLLNADSNKDQLTQTFSIRGSWLLESDVEGRLKIYEDLKSLYHHRSEIVHTGVLCKGKKEKLHKVYSNLPYYIELTEKIAKEIILRGEINWTRLMLGG